MKKNIIIFLIFILFISVGINIYLFNYKKINNDKKLSKNIENNINYNNDFKKNNINYAEKLYNKFLKIDNLEDFKKYKDENGLDEILVLIIKLSDKKSWNKYWRFKYEYYLEKKDKYFLNNIKQFGNNPKKGFLSLLGKKFDEIKKGINFVSDKDLKMDLNVYFNSLGIKEALKNCIILRKELPEKYKGDNNSCEDKIYFYRATEKNQYCDKIIDNYKKKLCKDFLIYQDNLK